MGTAASVLAGDDLALVSEEMALLKDDRVVTPLRRIAPIADSPSNVYVLTDEDIRHSGATDIPTLLRRIPGIDVMQTTGADFNVSVRGDNQVLANKLLVLIDGRSVYVDVQASIAYAATKFRQRPGVKVTYDAFHYIDLVSGHQLQITNADQSRTFVGIYLHESRLYILEATVPARAPQPGLFQQSLSFLDAAGKKVRYPTIYYNRLTPMKNAFGPEQPR